MTIEATNQIGWTVEKYGEQGWESMLQIPFATKAEAQFHLENMHKCIGVEYRVYPALKTN